MEAKKKRAFIIHFVYFPILLLMAFTVLKYGLSISSPLVTIFLIAWILKGPIEFVSGKFHLNRKPTAILVMLLFYSTIGFLIFLLDVKALSVAKELTANLPGVYAYYVEPALISLFDSFEQSIFRVNNTFLAVFMELETQFTQSAGQMVSGLSIDVMGYISRVTSSLPGLSVEILFMIISTFFVALDYHRLTGFCLMQLDRKARDVFFQIKEYVVGTLLVRTRSYVLIIMTTFVGLAVGLSVIGIKNSVSIAFLIALFDILPVFGTGSIMIPWATLTALQGDYPLAPGFLLVYLSVTAVCNILELRIVDGRIGVHPVVTLAGVFVGAQLFGIPRLFGFPIGISLLRHLNERGAMELLKMAEEK